MGRHYFRRGTCYSGPGVYLIRHKVSLKPYVGSAARSVKGRWKNHRAELNAGTHPNIHLQRAWNKYGADAFEFILLEKCEPEDCLAREQYWIDELDAFRSGYNRCPKAGSRFGAKLSEETKAKIRAKKVGKKMSDEARAKMRETRKNLVNPMHRPEVVEKFKTCHWSNGPRAAEIAAKISAAQKGKKISPETVAKMKATKKARPRHMTDEEKEHLSKMTKGRKMPPEFGAKISASKKGRKMSAEHYANYMASRHGKVKTE